MVFSTPDARISADWVVFNTRTKLGTFTLASGIAALGERGEQDRSMFGTMEPDIYFYGETIEKIGPDKYRIHKGGFTSCVQPSPRWEIVSGNATSTCTTTRCCETRSSASRTCRSSTCR